MAMLSDRLRVVGSHGGGGGPIVMGVEAAPVDRPRLLNGRVAELMGNLDQTLDELASARQSHAV